MLNTIVYFFPSNHEQLNAVATLEVLQKAKWNLENNYSILHPSVEANGHLVWEPGRYQINDCKHAFQEYKKILSKNIDITIHSDVISISYAIHDTNSNISLSWSRKWFYFLDKDMQLQYLQIILKLAQVANASYIIFLEDHFDVYGEDRFEDRFINVGDYRILNDIPKKWDFVLDEIWIRNKALLKIKSQKKMIELHKVGFDFTAYRLENIL